MTKNLTAMLSIMLVLSLGAVAKRLLEDYLAAELQLPTTTYSLEVKRGSSVTSVIHQLAEKGIVSCSDCLVAYARLVDKTQIKSGEYELVAPASHSQLLDVLIAGKVKQYSVTLVEGWSVVQALQALASKQPMQKILLENELQQITGYENPEGWLFPDTYNYDSSISDKQIVTKAYQRMQQVLMQEWEQRAEGLPYDSPYEALIMASLIEKETSVDSEREQIAGVFVARLNKGMRLQTDPTVIYAMGESYQGNIRRRDLKIDSPYNTYRVKGLPPTPIALPGQRSIQAALNPLINGMLYFVGKGNGYHYFSATLEEHNKAVNQYQRSQRTADYRSTPLAN